MNNVNTYIISLCTVYRVSLKVMLTSYQYANDKKVRKNFTFATETQTRPFSKVMTPPLHMQSSCNFHEISQQSFCRSTKYFVLFSNSYQIPSHFGHEDPLFVCTSRSGMAADNGYSLSTLFLFFPSMHYWRICKF